MSKEHEVRRVFDPTRAAKIDAGEGIVIEIVKRTRRGKRFKLVVVTPKERPAKLLTEPPATP